MGKARRGVIELLGMLASGKTRLPYVPEDEDIRALETAIRDAVERAARKAVEAEQQRINEIRATAREATRARAEIGDV